MKQDNALKNEIFLWINHSVEIKQKGQVSCNMMMVITRQYDLIIFLLFFFIRLLFEMAMRIFYGPPLFYI